ncbi:hypothetical protein OEZ86_002318 [Tetradesmus obliquus]|nr:hypothetical protein OEZ86_002318 [Tetradesmus obliquus]
MAEQAQPSLRHLGLQHTAHGLRADAGPLAGVLSARTGLVSVDLSRSIIGGRELDDENDGGDGLPPEPLQALAACKQLKWVVLEGAMLCCNRAQLETGLAAFGGPTALRHLEVNAPLLVARAGSGQAQRLAALVSKLPQLKCFGAPGSWRGATDLLHTLAPALAACISLAHLNVPVVAGGFTALASVLESALPSLAVLGLEFYAYASPSDVRLLVDGMRGCRELRSLRLTTWQDADFVAALVKCAPHLEELHLDWRFEGGPPETLDLSRVAAALRQCRKLAVIKLKFEARSGDQGASVIGAALSLFAKSYDQDADALSGDRDAVAGPPRAPPAPCPRAVPPRRPPAPHPPPSSTACLAAATARTHPPPPVPLRRWPGALAFAGKARRAAPRPSGPSPPVCPPARGRRGAARPSAPPPPPPQFVRLQRPPPSRICPPPRRPRPRTAARAPRACLQLVPGSPGPPARARLPPPLSVSHSPGRRSRAQRRGASLAASRRAAPPPPPPPPITRACPPRAAAHPRHLVRRARARARARTRARAGAPPCDTHSSPRVGVGGDRGAPPDSRGRHRARQARRPPHPRPKRRRRAAPAPTTVPLTSSAAPPGPPRAACGARGPQTRAPPAPGPPGRPAAQPPRTAHGAGPASPRTADREPGREDGGLMDTPPTELSEQLTGLVNAEAFDGAWDLTRRTTPGVKRRQLEGAVRGLSQQVESVARPAVRVEQRGPGPILELTSNAARLVIVTSAGHVGVGTAAPPVPLEVVSTRPAGALRVTQTSAAGPVAHLAASNDVSLLMAADGNVGVGSTAPTARLDVGGTARVQGTAAFDQYVCMQKDLETSGKSPARSTGSRRSRGTTYTRGGERATGVIAQEVRDVLPEAVREGPGGVLGVAYGTMVGLLIEAVNELRARVDASAGAR